MRKKQIRVPKAKRRQVTGVQVDRLDLEGPRTRHLELLRELQQLAEEVDRVLDETTARR